MKNSKHSRTRAFVASLGLVLFISAAGLRAQEPWPPSPLVPPDTTTYRYMSEYGAVIPQRRPPDSLIIPGVLMIRFRQGALDSAKQMATYWEYFYGHLAKHKGAEPLSGPFGGFNSPRGWPIPLRELLFSERFGLDSTNNVIKDSALTSFLLSEHGHTLQRLTTASPLDTLSVTRQGDTIGCDHHNWMILKMDSTTNPLLLTGLLMALYPRDIIVASPSYRGIVLFGHIPADTSFKCQTGDRDTMIDVSKAWDYEVGDTNIIVAHYDQGIDYRHPGFLDSVVGEGHKFVFSWDYYDNTNLSYLSSQSDHGTACMGILALQTNRDSITPTGIAGGWGPLAGGTDTIERGRGISVAALADAGLNSQDYTAAIFEASAHSPMTPYGRGVHAINTSAGIVDYEVTVHSAVNYAFENGVVQVAANGNFGENTDTFGRALPADADPSWVIAVGEYDENKERVALSQYGFSLDILAPSGDDSYHNCGFPNLNWTTRDTGTPPHYFYEGYGGTSISAPNVTGSAALLLSTFYRRDTVHMMHIEPEDIERILEAAATRGDADRDTLATRNNWRPNSGFGYLDIGNAYQMMDTTLSIDSSNYRLYHYHIWDTNQMIFSPWTSPGDTPTLSWTFYVPTDDLNAFGGSFNLDSLKHYRERPYLLNECGGRWDYLVRYRLVTAQMILPDTFQKSDAVPMFAWGRSGGPSAKSGWSLAQENFQTGFSEVINGTGGDTPPGPLPGGLEEGIFHNNDTIVVQTVQYDVWGYDTINGQYDIYLGHCPRDTSLGLNFSVFARPKILASSVTAPLRVAGEPLDVLQDDATHSVTAYYSITSPLRNARIEIYDALGRLVASLPHVSANIGWNQTVLPASALVNGVYFCRLSGENYSQSKTFTIVK